MPKKEVVRGFLSTQRVEEEDWNGAGGNPVNIWSFAAIFVIDERESWLLQIELKILRFWEHSSQPCSSSRSSIPAPSFWNGPKRIGPVSWIGLFLHSSPRNLLRIFGIISFLFRPEKEPLKFYELIWLVKSFLTVN